MANKIIKALASQFLRTDAARKSGKGNPAAMAIKDRMNEGRLMAGLMGPLAPAATLPVAGAGAIYEGVKYAGQKTGLGKYFPGPFKTGKNTSPASMHNVTALMKGFTEQATGQRGFLVNKIKEEVGKKTGDLDVGTD